MTTPADARKDFLARLRVFTDSAGDLLREWHTIEREHPSTHGIGEHGYPFEESFDEMFQKIMTWNEAQKHDAAMYEPAPFRVGARVRTRVEIDRYPSFLVAAGETGTVVVSDEGTLSVRMDQHIVGAEEWDNEIMWTENEDTLKDVPADLEVLP